MCLLKKAKSKANWICCGVVCEYSISSYSVCLLGLQPWRTLCDSEVCSAGSTAGIRLREISKLALPASSVWTREKRQYPCCIWHCGRMWLPGGTMLRLLYYMSTSQKPSKLWVYRRHLVVPGICITVIPLSARFKCPLVFLPWMLPAFWSAISYRYFLQTTMIRWFGTEKQRFLTMRMERAAMSFPALILLQSPFGCKKCTVENRIGSNLEKVQNSLTANINYHFSKNAHLQYRSTSHWVAVWPLSYITFPDDPHESPNHDLHIN